MSHIDWLPNSARRMARNKLHNTHLISVLDGAGCIPEPRVISSFSISSASMRQTTSTQSSRFLQKNKKTSICILTKTWWALKRRSLIGLFLSLETRTSQGVWSRLTGLTGMSSCCQTLVSAGALTDNKILVAAFKCGTRDLLMTTKHRPLVADCGTGRNPLPV